MITRVMQADADTALLRLRQGEIAERVSALSGRAGEKQALLELDIVRT